MEKPVQFHCRGKRLYGILHRPDEVSEVRQIVVMVVGGPQTRVGSHRSYVQIARALKDRGLTVFRFDYEGLGDSEGDFVGFEYAAPSIRVAIDYLFATFSQLRNVVIWSLCDGATASLIYAEYDQKRIKGMILCNPFVETVEGKAKTIIRYYYIRRLLDKEFWRKVFLFKFNAIRSARSFGKLAMAVLQRASRVNVANVNEPGLVDLFVPLPDQIAKALCHYQHPVRFLLSTNDLTAMEFRDSVLNRTELTPATKNGRVAIQYIEDADHTFSSWRYKKSVVEFTLSALSDLNSHAVETLFSETLTLDTLCHS